MVGARTPPLQHLCGVFKRGLHAFQGEQRLHGRSDAPQEDNRSGGVEKATEGEPALATLL